MLNIPTHYSPVSFNQAYVLGSDANLWLETFNPGQPMTRVQVDGFVQAVQALGSTPAGDHNEATTAPFSTRNGRPARDTLARTANVTLEPPMSRWLGQLVRSSRSCLRG